MNQTSDKGVGGRRGVTRRRQHTLRGGEEEEENDRETSDSISLKIEQFFCFIRQGEVSIIRLCQVEWEVCVCARVCVSVCRVFLTICAESIVNAGVMVVSV